MSLDTVSEFIAQLEDFMVTRVLDHFEVPHRPGTRWTGEPMES